VGPQRTCGQKQVAAKENLGKNEKKIKKTDKTINNLIFAFIII